MSKKSVLSREELAAALESVSAELVRATRAAQRLRSERKEVRHSLDLVHQADRRGIEMWQEAHPDQKHTWPDRGKMIFWLLEQLDAKGK